MKENNRSIREHNCKQTINKARDWTPNHEGFKDGAECYRTFNGIRWEWWPDTDIAKLRKAGVRCRKSKSDVFIHPDDYTLADQTSFMSVATLNSSP